MGGRCAPPAERVAVFALDGVDPRVAVAAGESVSSFRVDVAESTHEELDEGETSIELDAETRVVGFDQNGIITIGAGDEVEVTGRSCQGEGSPLWPT